ncbi:MAG TPA: magnesium transporter CorA family protein [Actinomycetota bacterium]|jgi:Mg2+ and Co2+ transporter CorA|nr:magnesium transporter CorA family protein [Actinomycetota bacterium]
MDVHLITAAGIEECDTDDLPGLLERRQGLVWVDIPQMDAEAARVLAEVFKFHPLAIQDCENRNHVPKVHVYTDHVFLALHAPELGKGGHVHHLELDQFVGPGYLVTVHGPLDPEVLPGLEFRETGAVLKRIQAGRFRPARSFELSHAIVSAMTRHKEGFVGILALEVGLLEQRVIDEEKEDPEEFLEELFRARHGLIAVRTMAALSSVIYGRLGGLTRFVPADAQPLVVDIADQFERIKAMADGETEFLQAVIEFHQAMTNTKMTIAAERLAVIAAVTLPITALSSIYGMNVIVNERTHLGQLTVLLVIMLTMSLILLRWAKRQGWW